MAAAGGAWAQSNAAPSGGQSAQSPTGISEAGLKFLWDYEGPPRRPVSETPTAAERRSVADCLKLRNDPEDQTQSGDTCVGLVSEKCQEDSGQLGNTWVFVACDAREHQIWDEILNDRYRKAMQAYQGREEGNANPAASLRKMQRLWIQYAEAKCELEAAEWGSGSGRHSAASRCRLQETAARAIELDARLRFER
jgi:uncharacterized protein YecT (DUF1311 family)